MPSTPPPSSFLWLILQPAAKLLGMWPVPSVSPCPLQVIWGQQAEPGWLPRTGMHVPCPRQMEQPPGTTLHVPRVIRGPGWVLGGDVPRMATVPWYSQRKYSLPS